MYGRAHEKSAKAKATATAKSNAKPKGRGKAQQDQGNPGGSVTGTRRSKKKTYSHQTYVRDFVDPCHSKIRFLSQ